MEIAGYLASFLMGITLGLMGGGGSILTVPILVYLFQVPPVEATTSSLFIVGSASLMAAIQYGRRKELDLKLAVYFALPSLIGIYLARSVLLPSIPGSIGITDRWQLQKGTLILVSFAILMMLASFSMIRKKRSAIHLKKNSKVFVGAQGVVTGFVTGFVGAGGGFIILPILVNIFQLPIRVAIGTSLTIIAINTLFGFAGSLLVNVEVNWQLQLIVLAIAIVGSLFGVRFSKQIDEVKLKKAFGYFVLIVGIAILFERL